MHREPDQNDICTEVTRAVEQEIRERTYRRVSQLHVEAHDGQVVLRGRTPTYYLKQLAQVAALEVLGANRTLVNDIQVEREKRSMVTESA